MTHMTNNFIIRQNKSNTLNLRLYKQLKHTVCDIVCNSYKTEHLPCCL